MVAEWIKKLPIRLFDDPDIITKMNMTMPTISWLGYFMSNFINFLSYAIGAIGILILALNNSMLLFAMGILLIAISLPIGCYNSRASYKLWKNEGNNQRVAEIVRHLPISARGQTSYKNWNSFCCYSFAISIKFWDIGNIFSSFQTRAISI